MITIVYSTHKETDYNNKFKQHLIESVGIEDVQILEYQNNNQFSLAQVYNSGITSSFHSIVVCCHNDIKLEKGWGKKLLEDFENNSEYGIIGKAGSCYFSESGIYWERMSTTMVGQVWHHPEGQKKWINNYSYKSDELIPVVTLDGLFLAFDKNKIKHTFDESYGKFHFYDHGFCVPNYLDGVKLGVTSSFEITHQSVGQPNQEFFDSKELFVQKYKDKLPLDLKPTKVLVPQIFEQTLKNVGKVAIIIPTKGKLDLLFQCIESFYEHCNPKLFDIFIADTGSSEEEIEQIEILVNSVDNIKLIKYNYYNFAKINNDVVKNYVGKEYEFLLFCNNDIKILNNIVYGMLKVFKEKPKVGTVGCRLYFGDNTIQHDGVILTINQKNQVSVTHKNLFSYYPPTTGLNKIFGNTGGLMMIRKFTFEKNGFFNEKYTTCFEDVELNGNCLLMGLDNYCDSNLVAYHYESQTRGKGDDNRKGEFHDYASTLLPYLVSKINVFANKTQIYRG